MKVTYGTINNSAETIRNLANLDFSVEIAFALYENMCVIDEKMKFYTKKVSQTIEKYAEKKDGQLIFDEKGGILLQKDKKEDVAKELNAIAMFEISVPLVKINRNALKQELLKNPDTKIKANDLFKIAYMLSDEKDRSEQIDRNI